MRKKFEFIKHFLMHLGHKLWPHVAFIYLLAFLPTITMLVWLLTGFPNGDETKNEDYNGFGFTFDCDSTGNPACAWKVFNWHPLLMTFAFLTLFSQAITAFKLLPLTHIQSKMVHFGIQTTGMICALTGFIIIVTFKEKTANKNFYTAHSYAGLLALFLFIIQYTIGFVSFLFPKLPDKPRGTVHSFHVFAGFCIYVLTMIAIYTGITDRQVICGGGGCGMSKGDYTWSYIGGNLVMILGVIVSISVFWSHRPPTNRSLYEKKHEPEQQPIINNYETNHWK